MAKKKTVEEAAGPKAIELQRLEDASVKIKIKGVTPLIPHRWSEKAIAMMAEKQARPGVRQKREPKDPEQEAEDSCYWVDVLDEKTGIWQRKAAMPAVAFKAAMVGACRFFEEPSMTAAKIMFYVVGDDKEQLVPIDGTKEMRTDTPRLQTGVADLRYRYQFMPWSATLEVKFPPQVITVQSIYALLDAGGRGGIGDWRPSAPRSMTGTYGQFRIDEKEPMAVMVYKGGEK